MLVMKSRDGKFLWRMMDVTISPAAVKKYKLSSNKGVIVKADPNREQLVEVKIGTEFIDLHAKSLYADK